MSFGVTSAGFVPATIDDVKANLEAALKAVFGDSIDVSPQSNFGQWIGVSAEALADLWAAGEDVNASFNPDSAAGVALDNLCAITGTVRKVATKSTVTLTATGTPATVLAIGRIASVVGTGKRFVTTAGATIGTASAWASAHGYTAGDRVKNASRIYLALTTGTSAGSGGPTTTASSIVDNTVTWKYLGDGAGYIDVAAEGEFTGPNIAASGTLTVIETPVAGWSGVYNILDAALGTDIETDAALRIRRETELRGNGRAALEAMRSGILDALDVTACTIFENTTDTTDGDSIPPHAVECLVSGGTDDDVADAVFANVAAGIATYGTTTEVVTDSQGNDHIIKFTRPTVEPIYIRVDVVVDAANFPSDGAAQIKAAIVAFGNLQKTGKDVVAAAIGAQAFKVSGVLDTPIVYVGLAFPATSAATIVVTNRQIATYDTSRVTVNVSNGVP